MTVFVAACLQRDPQSPHASKRRVSSIYKEVQGLVEDFSRFTEDLCPFRHGLGMQNVKPWGPRSQGSSVLGGGKHRLLVTCKEMTEDFELEDFRLAGLRYLQKPRAQSTNF